jgi:hypothetical protein
VLARLGLDERGLGRGLRQQLRLEAAEECAFRERAGDFGQKVG